MTSEEIDPLEGVLVENTSDETIIVDVHEGGDMDTVEVAPGSTFTHYFDRADPDVIADVINRLYTVEKQAGGLNQAPLRAKVEAARKLLEQDIPDLQTHE